MCSKSQVSYGFHYEKQYHHMAVAVSHAVCVRHSPEGTERRQEKAPLDKYIQRAMICINVY